MRSCAFTFGDTKNSLLYFDYVVPTMGTIEIVYLDQSEEARTYLKVAKSLGEDFLEGAMKIRFLEMAKALPPAFQDKNLLKELAELNRINFDMYYNRYIASPPELSAMALKKEMAKWSNLLRKIMLGSNTLCEITSSFPDEFGIGDKGEEPEIMLSNINLVDVTKVSIPHILEFREDKDSRIKLLRLRSFLAKDCAGLTVNQVEDELMLALHDYEKVSKNWDLATRNSSLSILLDSREEMMAFGGSLLAAISGAPIASAVAATVGSAFAIGKVWLNVSEKKCEKRDVLGSSPISYIVHAKDKLEKE